MAQQSSQDPMQSLQTDMRLTAKRIELSKRGKSVNRAGLKENLQPLAPESVGREIAKNDASSKTPSRLPRAVKRSNSSAKKKNNPIRRLPAGYTWNKGGRLKEIRIRTRARKFLTLWKLKTFGRVLPSRADGYFKKQIVKSTFAEWRTFWWEARVEWKLQVRAEYHHRYSLYSLVWLNWRQHTLDSREKRVKLSIAETHWINREQKSKFGSWKLYIHLRRTKKILYNSAHLVIESNRVKNTWKTWKDRLHSARRVKADNDVAVLHWMSSAQRRAWVIWSSLCSENCRMKSQAHEADNHHKAIIVQKCLTAWLRYRSICVGKQKQKDFAACTRNRYLATHCLLIWHQRWKRSVELKNKSCAIEELSRRCLKRRAFVYWIFFLQCKEERRRKFASAQIYHRRKMLMWTVRNWKHLVAQEQRKASLLYEALSFRRRSLLKNNWRKWQNRLEISEDAKIVGLTEIASQHCNTILVQNMLQRWLDYINWRRKRRAKRLDAHAHYASKALPFCFQKWRNFVAQSKIKTDLQNKGNNFRRDTLKMKYFYFWWENFDQCREYRTLERIAFVHNREITLRNNFICWKRRACKSIIERRYSSHADSCYREILLKRVFKQWKELLRIGRSERRKIIRAATYCYHNTLAGSWIAWRTYVQGCKNKRLLLKKAVAFHNTNLLIKCTVKWKGYLARCQNFKAVADKRWRIKQKEKLLKIFVPWRHATTRRLRFKDKLNKAVTFHASSVLSAVLNHWRAWSAMHYQKRVEKEARISEITVSLCRRKVRRILNGWRDTAVALRVEKRKMAVAHEHFKLKICKVTFQVWKVYRYVRLKKTLMNEQARYFHSQNLVKTGFSVWKLRLEEKKVENQLEGEALWHWALTLQQKVLIGWIEFTNDRKRKNARYEQALQQRRLYLLRKGCVRILETHSDIMHTKMQASAIQHAHSSYMGYHLAWKFARKWREIVKNRRERKNHVDAQSPKATNLTFIVDRPMYFPIPGAFPMRDKNSPPENQIGWLPEPRPNMPVLHPFTIPNVPSSPKRSSQKFRPVPRGPDFLMDSLQREGLDEDVEFGGGDGCVSRCRSEKQAPRTISASGDMEQEGSILSESVAINRDASCRRHTELSYEQTQPDCTNMFQRPFMLEPPTNYHAMSPEHPSNTTQDTPCVSQRVVRFKESYEMEEPNMLLLPPAAFTCSQTPNDPVDKSDTSAEESHDEGNSFSSLTGYSSAEETQADKVTKVKMVSTKDRGLIVIGKENKMSRLHLPHHPMHLNGFSGASSGGSKSIHSENSSRKSPKFGEVPKTDTIMSEIDQIKREMQSYQHKKENLKTLKRQKEVLENWMLQQQSRPVCDSSIFSPVQDEIQQLTDDLRDLALEIQSRRPQMEKLIERVKVLSKRPAQR